MNIEIQFSVTEAASEQLKKLMPQDSFVRVSAEPSGCSGTAYGLGIAESDDFDSSDIIEEIMGIKFVAEKSSAINLDGVVLDWYSSDGREGFKFIDPRTSSGCCGRGGCSSKKECK